MQIKYTYYISVLAVILLGLFSKAMAQNTISGKVVDAISRQPLEAALVTDAKTPAL